MSSQPDNSGITTADLALVASCPSHRDAHERGLVALSMDIPYWVLHTDGHYHLLVETHSSTAVSREVAAYDDDLHSPHPSIEFIDRVSPLTIALAYLFAIILGAAFLFQKANEPWSVETFGNDTLALFNDAEWWRPATALFLHGDLAHLLGNIAFGIWFGVLAAQALGPAIALFTIFLGGILGNTLTAGIYYPAHGISIGASTAVFAALGVLVGNGLYQSIRNHSLTNLASRLVPLAGGLALLALTGSGGTDGPGNTDLLAHVCGFLLGIPLGIVGASLPQSPLIVNR